ncbi:TPA: TrbI/VirB10 family protein [Legionella pneumophila]
MNTPDDLMSPQASPTTRHTSGVRRVNNLPLVLVLGAFCLFVLMVAWVAMKRARQQQTIETSAPVVHHVNAAKMAADIVAGSSGGIILPAEPPKVVNTRLALPVAVVEHPDEPPVKNDESAAKRSQSLALPTPVNPDEDRIRMAKMEQFEDAVKAKMSIPLPDQLTPKAALTPEGREPLALRLQALKRQMQEMDAGEPTVSYQEKLQRIRAIMAGTSRTDALEAMDDTTADRWDLGASVDVPKTAFVLRAGAVLPGIMISGVKASLPGQVIGQVAQDVYDTATGKYLLIPQGTRLIGLYSNDVSYGQDSVLIAWQRLVFPDGKALDIGSMPGGDSAGYSGFHDKVDNHYGRIFGSALLMSGVVAGITYSQNPQQTAPIGQAAAPTAGSVMSAALGQELGQVSAQLIAKNINLAPSLTIRPGYPFNVIVVKDMTFKRSYQSFDY